MVSSRIDSGAREAVSGVAAGVSGAPLWLRLVLPLVVAGLSFAAFVPALSEKFVNWDDDRVVYDNQAFRGLTLPHLKWDFTTFTMGHYHPLTWISLGVDYSIWGIKDAFGYHLSNLLLHALSAVFFYLLAARVLSVARGITGPPPLAAHVAGGLAALLFAVHPLRVESVAWVTERRDVLSVFFLIPCVLCYLRYALGGSGRWLWYAAAVALLLASLLSKAWGMTLPVVLLVLDAYPLRRFSGASGTLSARAVVRALADKIPFAVLGALAAYAAINAQAAAPEAMKPLAEYGVLHRCAQACYGLVFYIWKTVLPTTLLPLYEIPADMSAFEPRFVISAVLVAGGLVALLRSGRRFPGVAAALVVYTIVLLPVLGFTQCGPQLVADRYSYVACQSLMLLVGSGLWCGASWLARRPSPIPGLAVGGAAVLVAVAVLGVLTWRQAHIWRDSPSLWKHLLASVPNSYRGHYNLGAYYTNHNQPDLAVPELREALRLAPDELQALVSLGRALYLQGKTSEAVEYYAAALNIRNDQPDLHYRLAVALQDLGRHEEAALHFRQAQGRDVRSVNASEATRDAVPDDLPRLEAAIKSNPNDPNARYDLGVALAQVRRFDEAAKHLSECVRLAPNHFEAHCRLAAVRAAQGDMQSAAAEYQKALGLQPESAMAHTRLADLLAATGQPAEAVAHYRKALQLMPGRWGSANSLALLLASSDDPAIRNPQEAVKLAEQACQATSFSQPAFLSTLATAYAAAGRFEDAVQAMEKLMPLAAADPNRAAVEDVRRRIGLYQQHRTSKP